MYENQFNIYGFEWVDLNHREECVLVYRRRGKEEKDDLIIFLNVAPVPRWDWEIEINGHRYEKEIFNSDLEKYWGSGNVTNPDIRMQEVKTKVITALIIFIPLVIILFQNETGSALIFAADHDSERRFQICVGIDDHRMPQS